MQVVQTMLPKQGLKYQKLLFQNPPRTSKDSACSEYS